MLLIGNDCTSGYIYQLLGVKYNNPFFWTNVLDDDFVTLISNFNVINYDEYRFSLLDETQHQWKTMFPKNTLLSAVDVDNQIRMYFTHHLYSNDYGKDVIIQPFNRLVSKNIEQIVLDNYTKRVQRMKECVEEPIFIWHEWDRYDINQLINSRPEYKKILLTNQLETSRDGNVEIINFSDITNGSIDQKDDAKWLVEHSEILKEFGFVK